MKKYPFLLLFLLLMGFVSCGDDLYRNEYNLGVNIIPAPEYLQQGEGAFELDPSVRVFVSEDSLSGVCEYFLSKIKTSTGFDLQFASQALDAQIVVELRSDLSIASQGYHLSVSPERITITSGDLAGAFYGFSSLMQLLPSQIESPTRVSAQQWLIPSVEIKDKPLLDYRGVMIDVSRHFFDKEQIMRHIELLSLFKINRLHWHLSDNQGWRIESKAFPKLTEQSSSRIDETGAEYGGFYTQEDIREVVAFAAERFVTIVPEIDIPAHSMAACVAYPELSCEGAVVPVRSMWGPDSIVMCPGKEYMFDFLDTLFAEMAELFPGEYYHIGGDECPKNSWRICPDCQRRIAELGLKDNGTFTALEQLQSYTTSRLEVILAKYGKKIIGWDEILEGGVTPSATIMSWRGETGGIEAAHIGNNVIMSPNNKGFYLDYYQGDSKVDEVCFGNKAYLVDLYSYDPIPSEVREAGLEDRIMGVQANLWSEYVYSDDRLDRALYPRVLALAEAGWSDPTGRDFTGFCRRMAGSLVRLELKGADYHTPLVEQVGGSFDRVAFTDSLVLDLTTSRPLPIVYTLDGSEPTLSSARYFSPQVFTESATLKVASISESMRVGRVRSIELVKEPYRPAQEVEVDTLTKGLRFYRKEGAYQSVEQLDGVVWDSITVISTLNAMVGRAFTTFDREVERFATMTTGYFEISEDGIYLFSSENERVVVDGLTIVDNHAQVKRHSRADGSMALGKGLHNIEVYFINDYIGGIPANWMGSAVRCRLLDSTVGFKPVTNLWY